MKFINNKERKLARIGNSGDAKWIRIEKGQEIDIPQEIGEALGLESIEKDKIKALESKVGRVKVETKVKEKKEPKSSQNKDSDNFEEELKSIKGIGKKTAKDILRIYPSRDDLIRKVNSKNKLPFRDDIELKLREKYGRKQY